jgi:cytochrome P450
VTPLRAGGDDVAELEFDPFDPEVQRDPYPIYERFRNVQPLAFSPRVDAWFLFRFEDVLRAVHDHDTFVSGQGINLTPSNESSPARTLISIDNPVHDELRSVVSRLFTPKAMERFDARVRVLAREHVDAFATRGSCELMHELAIPLPIIVVGDLLGVRPEDRMQFREWADALVHQDVSRPETLEPARLAGAAIGAYFLDVIERRRAEPTDDLMSVLLGAEVQGEPLPSSDIVGMAFLLIVAGTETTTNLIGNAALALAAHPEQLAILRDDMSISAAAIEETLRFDGPVQGLARVAVEDVETAGGTLRAGSRVQLRYGSANRDEREFADADMFDVRRPIGRHVAFGHGIHHCLGAALARLEGRIMLEELVTRVGDWKVVDDEIDRWPSAEVRGPAELHLEFSAS